MSGVDADYLTRLNRVVDYVQAHLGEELTLDELAGVACFSRFHFARLFHAQFGETPFELIRRVRLERAAALLRAHPREPVISVALRSGFENASAFSRSFRERFGCSPSEWRCVRDEPDDRSKAAMGIDPVARVGERWSQMRIARRLDGPGWSWSTTTPDGRARDVRLEELPATRVAYVRHMGRYAADPKLFERLFERLFTWAVPRELVRFPLTTYCIYYDPPSITDDDRLRVSVCLPIPPDVEPSGEVGHLTIPGGLYGVVRQLVDHTEYGELWSWAYSEWLPQSGYEPDDRWSFERYVSREPTDLEASEVPVEICIPVRVSGG